MELSSAFVCLMGIATVFAGLVCLIVICSLVGLIARDTKKVTPKAETPVYNSTQSVIENREELVAAISAAVAEELGEDVTNIKILSLRRI